MKNALAFFCIAMIFSSCMIRQPKPDLARTVTVNSTGTVFMQADTATINFSLVTTNRSLLEAARINNEAVENLRSELIAAGYTAGSIESDGYTITQENPYRVSTAMRIILKNTQAIANVTEIAAKAGATQFLPPEFSVSDMEGALREARTNAIRQAFEAATLMAKTAGAELGEIVSIYEIHQNGESANDNEGPQAKKASLTPGTQKISVKVSCTYNIN